VTQRTSDLVPIVVQSMPVQLALPTSKNSSDYISPSVEQLELARPLISTVSYRIINLYAGSAQDRTNISEVNSQQGGPYGRA
jgi:hypothetical protein